MAFKAIGTLAGEVLRKAEMAARGHDGAHKLKGDGPTVRVHGSIGPSFAQGEGGHAERIGMGKKAGAVEAPASHARGDVRQTAKREEVKAFTASLSIIDRCERIALPQRPSPVAAMRSHLLTEWLAHETVPMI